MDYDGECLFNDNHGNKEYNNNNKYDDTEDGKGLHGGADDGGESNYNGCDFVCEPAVGDVEWRASIVGPHAAIINNDDKEDCRHAPPSGTSRPTGCLSSSLMSPTTVNGGGTRAFGAWLYVWWKKRRLALLYSFIRF